MASPQLRTDVTRRLRLPKAVDLIAFALCVAQALYLLTSHLLTHWPLEAGGYTASDFVNVWAAGQLALQGTPALAYDLVAHRQAQVAAVGHDFSGNFPWYYPPIYLIVATGLASLPYLTAWIGWLLATFPAYLAAIRAIIGERVAILLACAFPAVLSNALVGQNGFLTAGLLGGTLATMERRPWLAGCFLGLLTYKPHLGLLFPIVLIAAGRWRVFTAAAATATALSLASLAAFGPDAWYAFVHALAAGSQSTLSQGSTGWGKLQTTYGFVRWLGGSEVLAWSVHGLVVATCAIALCVLWRSRIPFVLKAAALATGALLATPYLFLYDLVAVAVPMAFLLRAGMASEVATYEWVSLGLASLFILLYPAFEAPVGIPALLIVAGLVGARVLKHSVPSRQTAPDIIAPSAI
jgi:arabinofuranan 3-O-arabinosyltransferase